eukprot:jgi/Botrbrau1/13124/Bobra.0187s0081.1
MSFIFGTTYLLVGAICGTPPGEEFVGADEAAKEVGARVVLADRSQSVTMARLQQATARYVQQLRNKPAEAKLKEDPDGEGVLQEQDSGESSTGPDSPDRESRAKSGDPWGLKQDGQASDFNSVMRQFKTFMQEGGCSNPEAAMTSFKRMMQTAWLQKPVDTDDLAAVRECINPVLEHARTEAMQGKPVLRNMEVKALAEAKGAAGLSASVPALEEVVGNERDLILARRLWEAAGEAGDRPVVGVFGAGHVRGIKQIWPQAGSWEVKAKADEYCQMPPGYDRGSQALGGIVSCAALGFLGYRFPRVASVVVVGGLSMAVPYVAFSAYMLNRFSGATGQIIEAAKRLDELQGTDPTAIP